MIRRKLMLSAAVGLVGVSTLGKIDIQESHSLVEVHDTVARTVIQALNGTTIRGRAVRADFDRPQRGRGGSRTAPRSD